MKYTVGKLINRAHAWVGAVVLTIIGCWYPTLLFSQLQEYEAAYADSLLQLTRQATSDSAKIEHYFALSNFWSERDTAKAYGYIEAAKKNTCSLLPITTRV